MMKGTTGFRKAIDAYLKDYAEQIPAFGEKLKAEGKSLDECVNYILGEVEKSKRVAWTEQEVYGLAVHYYDESKEALGDIQDYSQKNGMIVGDVELTEEDRKEARDRAMKKYEEELVASMRRATAPKWKEKEEEPKAALGHEQLTLFEV